MIYYKMPDGTVYAYETEAERKKFGPVELVKLTKSETEDLILELFKSNGSES